MSNPSQLKIALVEDNPGDVRLLREYCREPETPVAVVESFGTLESALAALQETHYDLALLDLGLPDSSGLETLKRFRTTCPDLPVIVCSGLSEEDVALKTLKFGALDYLVKGEIDARSLRRAIRYAMERKRSDDLVARMNRLYQVLSRINEAIVRSTTVDELLATACDIAVGVGRFQRAVVVSVDSDSSKVRPISDSESDDGYFSEISVDLADPKLGDGTIGRALKTGRYDVCNDLMRDSRMEPWRASAEKRGFRSVASFPIDLAPGQRGLVVLFTSEANYFQQDEISLLVAVASDLSFAIGSLHAREEQRRAEAIVAASEERFRILSEATNDAIWDWDLTNDTAWWNEGLQNLFGYSRDEVPKGAASWTDHIHPDDRERVTSKIFKVIEEGGRIWNDEYRFLHKNGQVLNVLDRGRVIRDRDGKPVRMVGGMTDLTEILALRERTASILSSVSEGIYGVDPEGHILFENPAAASLFGWPAGSMIGKNLHATIHHHRIDGSDYPEDQCPILLTLRDGRPRRVGNEVFFRKDGTHFPVEYSCSPVKNAGGGITGAVVSFRDITEEQKSAARIAEQAALLDKAQDAIIVRDRDGKILFWNKGAENLYGWTRPEMEAGQDTDFLGNDSDEIRDAEKQCLATGEWKGELNHGTRDRRVITVESRWTLLRDSQGEPRSILMINTDITRRKRLEQQYLRAQRLESLGTLAGGIAHDLNNVLAPILMSIDLLKLKISDPDACETLDSIGRSARHGAEMIGQVLAFARGVEGHRSKVVIKDLFDEMQRIARDTFPKNITLTCDCQPGVWLVEADPTQLHQVLLNLLVNSRDALPDGGQIRLSASNITLDTESSELELDAKAGDFVRIDVEDNGSGIPAHILDKIFDPFFTTKELGSGTGLGLATSLAIAKGHGGFIRAYSEPGAGTRMRVYLPSASNADDPGTDHTAHQLPRGNGELVLVVDDEESILKVTRLTLENFGYKVIEATDGADAVAKYAANLEKIDLVLIDMMMPVMDGMAAIRVIRELNPSARIVAASGLSATEKAPASTNSGVRFSLAKPYTAETLLTVLRKALDA